MRSEKQLLLDEVQEQISQYHSFVVMSYEAFSVNAINEFRRSISQQGGCVEIVKKRILQKAAENAGIEMDIALFNGHIGLVFTGEDPIEATKFVYKFSKEHDDVIKVVGGYIDKQLCDAAAMKEISQLPSKQELRAQFVGLLEAPMANVVRVLDELLSSVVRVIDNKCKKEKD